MNSTPQPGERVRYIGPQCSAWPHGAEVEVVSNNGRYAGPGRVWVAVPACLPIAVALNELEAL